MAVQLLLVRHPRPHSGRTRPGLRGLGHHRLHWRPQRHESLPHRLPAPLPGSATQRVSGSAGRWSRHPSEGRHGAVRDALRVCAGRRHPRRPRAGRLSRGQHTYAVTPPLRRDGGRSGAAAEGWGGPGVMLPPERSGPRASPTYAMSARAEQDPSEHPLTGGQAPGPRWGEGREGRVASRAVIRRLLDATGTPHLHPLRGRLANAGGAGTAVPGAHRGPRAGIKFAGPDDAWVSGVSNQSSTPKRRDPRRRRGCIRVRGFGGR